MYHIAICEDDAIVRDDIVRRAGGILTDLHVDHDFAVFSSAEEMEAVFKDRANPFDLLLLDIQLPGKTGVALGAALRARDERVSIIFITNSADYALEGYKAQPCNYLLKPVGEAALAEAIRKELKRGNLHRMVVFQEKGRAVRIAASNILYLESYDHGTRVYTLKERFSFYIPLSQAQEMMPPELFARCHNSYLVNLSHIKTASSTKVVFQTGAELPVGRTYRDEFHRIFISHFFSR